MLDRINELMQRDKWDTINRPKITKVYIMVVIFVGLATLSLKETTIRAHFSVT